MAERCTSRARGTWIAGLVPIHAHAHASYVVSYPRARAIRSHALRTSEIPFYERLFLQLRSPYAEPQLARAFLQRQQYASSYSALSASPSAEPSPSSHEPSHRLPTACLPTTSATTTRHARPVVRPEHRGPAGFPPYRSSPHPPAAATAADVASDASRLRPAGGMGRRVPGGSRFAGHAAAP